MQITTLKVFCDLAETESFTRAAQINGVTQSAVSQQISGLERQFKTLLVERSRKNFRLTREGTLLHEYGRQIIQRFDSLCTRLQEIKDVISGSIRLATVYSIGLHTLPPYLKKFLKAFPAVNVHVEYRHASEVYEDVRNNAVDLGLVAYPQKAGNLVVVPLNQDKMVLVCHPENPLARKKSIKVKELDGQNFVHFSNSTPTRRAVDTVFRENGVTINEVMEFDNIETAKRAVEIDVGVAILPRITIRQELAKRTLAEVELDGVKLYRPLAALHKKQKVLSPAVSQFLKVLKEKPDVDF